MGSLIQVSDSNAIVYISSTAFFAQLTTIRDISGKRSPSNTITVSTVGGITFPDGTVRRTIDTPYASLTLDSSAKPTHAFPFSYGGSTDAQGISVEGATTVGSIEVYDALYVANTISSINLDAQTILIGSESILTRSILVSTMNSLGQTYTSSLYIPIAGLSNYILSNHLFSTVAGLGATYLSSASLRSTVEGLGTYAYLSTPHLMSTVNGLSSIYTTQSNLQSTIVGLGSFGYVSSADFLSTTAAFSGGYIRASNYTSTVAGLGSTYVSTSNLTSTIAGLGSLNYVSTSWLFSTTASLGGSVTAGDVTPLYTSTVAGLGTSKYLSLSGLTSTVTGVSVSNAAILQSTITGLGTAGYISVSHLTSTVQGLSNTYTLSTLLLSSVGGLFGAPYTTSFVSTVQGLGNYYVSTLTPMLSVLSNESVQLVSTNLGLPQTYISTPSLVSTVIGLSNTYITPSNLTSTVGGVGLINTSNLVSTVVGLGSLQPDGYLSTSQLFSTVSNATLANSTLFSQLIPQLASLPYGYISTASLVSTVQGLSNTYIISSNLISTVAGVGAVNTSNLVSTVVGLGSLQPNGYVSTSQLISTVSNVSASNASLFTQIVNGLASLPYTYLSTASLVSTVKGLSNIYITSSNLISTVANTGSFNGATLVSTVVGLGSLNPEGYVSTTQLFSTVSNVILANSNLFALVFPTLSNAPYSYITAPPLISTVTGLSNIYVSSSNLTSTVTATLSNNTAYLVSQVNGLSATYTLSNQLYTAVAAVNTSNSALFAQTMPLIASPPYNYISTASLVSTTLGINTISITPANLASTITGLSNAYTTTVVATVVNLGSAGTNPLISSTQLFSTVSNVNLANSNLFSQVFPTLGSPPYSYISSKSLQSTVAGLNLANYPFSNLPPVVDSLTSNLVSTVVGLGSLNPDGYVSTTQLFSTVSNVILANSNLFTQVFPTLSNSYITSGAVVSTVAGLGSSYISSQTLVATVSNYNTSTKYTDAQLTSSIVNLGTKGYISTASLTSTLQGLGGYGYISLPSLTSTVVGLSNTYVLSNIVPATYTTIQTNFSNYLTPPLTSTVAGLGSIGYISIPPGYTGIPSYLGVTSYISCLYAAEKIVLISTSAGVATKLGTLPAVTTTSINVPVQSNSLLFIYQNGSIVPSSNVSVRFDGIQMSNVYSTYSVTSSNFYASNYYADGTQLTNGSDRRLKFDITPLTGALSSIAHLEGVYYRLIEDPERQLLGFIAQDVEPIYPELVFTNGTKSIKYDSIGVILLEAIKELNVQCDELLGLLQKTDNT